MKRIFKFVPFGLVLALSLVAGAFAQDPSAKRAAAAPANIPVSIVEAGKPVQIESLPPEARAQLERVRAAAQSLANPSEPGAQKLNVTIDCTWSPLRCTITIQF